MRPAAALLLALVAGSPLATAQPQETAATLTAPLPPPRPTPQAAAQTAPPPAPICRDPRLTGTARDSFLNPRLPCGIQDPVTVKAIGETALSLPTTLDCPTARRFADWMEGVVRPAARTHLNASVAEVWIMGSYVCRTRNTQPGARISEHGRGRAVDIGGAVLSDGRRIDVLRDWDAGAEDGAGAFLAEIRDGACGLFSTVLGPGADRHHDNHLHLDTAPRDGDPYCR